MFIFNLQVWNQDLIASRRNKKLLNYIIHTTAIISHICTFSLFSYANNYKKRTGYKTDKQENELLIVDLYIVYHFT